ncbi:uncharacterized protein LOC100828321 [Brachypodium distachyon]|nr:uncharacterized protein LOC100828321 [Brachypodium distachyon]|eukprot:XP_010228324.1 uncharacterized protein LOC100828321 [Brachypodium distachyon]
MVQSVPYDHTASIECLKNPTRPLYNGGIIQNSEFNNGLAGWSVPFGVNTSVISSPSGNKFAETSNKAQPSRSVSQKFLMEANHHYSLSAWLQVSSGTGAIVKATFKAPNGAFIAGGSIVAKSGCWSMLKGGMTSYTSGPAELFFEADGAAVDIYVDSVSLQPFSFPEWDAHASISTSKTRKSTIKILARQRSSGEPLANAKLRINLLRPGFPLGNAMTPEILSNPAYEQWFASRFTVATFENEMKWYATEPRQNLEDYRVPDAMLRLAERHGIKVRGHNVVWDDPKTQMNWVESLSPDRLRAAVEKRVRSVVSRYAGKVIAWDVVNENLHGDFYESKLGADVSAQLYSQVGQIDRQALLFMNEYNTLEVPMDANALASKYMAKMNQIRFYPGNLGMKLAVGLESHFGAPNIPFMRATLDMLAQLMVPIWLTEVDVVAGPNQAGYLEAVLREGYGHPAVQGMVMWAAWHAKGCYVMCLTDNGFRNLPVGDVVDKLIAEWRTHPLEVTTGCNGAAELDLVHGEYNFTVTHPDLESPTVHTLTVDAASSSYASLSSDLTLDIKV